MKIIPLAIRGKSLIESDTKNNFLQKMKSLQQKFCLPEKGRANIEQKFESRLMERDDIGITPPPCH